MSDIVKGYDGAQQTYTANPYAYMQFPGQAQLYPTSCPGNSIPSYAGGWEHSDPSTDIMYMVTAYGNPMTVNEYKVNVP